MPLHLIERDITKMQVDAIVNSTNRNMVGYSGIDKLIHELGGEAFEEECRALAGKCCPGEAVYTKAYNLNCGHVIHTVSPWWEEGVNGEAAILRSCYRQSLELAEKLNCKSLAFPLIASGQMGYPVSEALRNAVETIGDYLELYSDMDVYLCLFGTAALRIARETYGDLDDLILKNARLEEKDRESEKGKATGDHSYAGPGGYNEKDLNDLIEHPGNDFVNALYDIYNEKGIVNVVPIYKAAGMRRSSYSHLLKGDTQAPKKITVIGFCMALKLTLEEAEKLLATAEYALSPHKTEDIVYRYFLEHKNYDIWEMNLHLEKYGLPCIIEA